MKQLQKINTIKRKQGGWTMVETLATVAFSAVLVAGIFGLKNTATAGNQSQNVGTAVSDMASKIQKNYSGRGSYDTLTATGVFGMGLVSTPLVWAATPGAVKDPWGNTMNISGNAAGATATFAITIGGATNPIDKATCTDIATQLATSADVVNVGAAATVANGLASGGTAYKSAANPVPDPAALGTACSGTSPVIAVQWH